MTNRLFYTKGEKDICVTTYDCPTPTGDDIKVKSIYTGVCRSDVAMYNGDFITLPKEIQGHECLGVITEVANPEIGFKVGDYVATRGEPGFADEYVAKYGTYVKVPEADPKYIIEPVACGINIVDNYLRMFMGQPKTFFKRKKYLIIGTGFLAQVVYKTLEFALPNKPNVYVIGNSNKKFWDKTTCTFISKSDLDNGNFVFDAVFDISSDPRYINTLDMLKTNGVHLICAEKTENLNVDTSKMLWENKKILFPSPRDANFIDSMVLGVELVRDGTIDTSTLWTNEYDRDTELEMAFKDANDRSKTYSRGYIKWQQ